MGRVGFFCAAMFTCAATFIAAGALAQSSDNVVAAEALFEAARADIAAGNLDAACTKFAESQRLDPAAGTLINLADCEERRHKLAAAWQLWRAASEQLPQDDARRPGVLVRRDAIDKRVPRLTVRLGPGVPKDATIRRDDVALATGTLDVALPVDPGEHRVQLIVPGHVPTLKTVTLSESAREIVVLELGPIDPIAMRTVESPHDDGKTMRILGLTAIGVGVVGVGVGAVTGVLAIDKKNEQEPHCFPANVCTPRGADIADAGKSLSTVSTIAFVAGAVGVAGGIALLWLAPKGKATLAPSVQPGGASLTFVGVL